MSRPEAREEARRWLAQAENDLAFTEHSMRGGFHAQACFHAQQVAEKAVKAVHSLRGARVVISHSVAGLLEVLDAAGLPVKELRASRRAAPPPRHPHAPVDLPVGVVVDAVVALAIRALAGATERARYRPSDDGSARLSLPRFEPLQRVAEAARGAALAQVRCAPCREP